MASAFSHALVAVMVGKAVPHREWSWRELVVGALCSVVPDLDVIGFNLGVQYGDVWGHRGLTHSLVFAVALSGVLAGWGYRRKPPAVIGGLFLYFFLCTASHGALDALTNGGLGVAFFSPFDTTRYFFPVRPVLVSPIGVDAFFNGDGFRVLASEAAWIWLPSCAAFSVCRAVQRRWPVASEAFPLKP